MGNTSVVRKRKKLGRDMMSVDSCKAEFDADDKGGQQGKKNKLVE
jgi:hypothetical protein